MSVVIANAPCSYGAFELTVGVDPAVPSPVALLDAVAQAGYRGVDLGPVGYLGTGAELGDRLGARGLALAGGYIEIAFSAPGGVTDALAVLDRTLDAFDAAPAGAAPARPTIADAGSPERFAAPGRGGTDRSLGLDDAGWGRLANGLALVVERCRERGYEPTFHHHVGTYVEAPWEIERLLERSDVGLCLDIGHLEVVGEDPLVALERWGERINHVHVKDTDRAVVAGVLAPGLAVDALWQRRAFGRLGEHDGRVAAFVEAVVGSGYEGWIVVEQDVFPDADDPDRPRRDQIANREFLRGVGL